MNELLLAAAGGTGKVTVEDVFSSDLWTGVSGANVNVVNGVDLITYGGMVMGRARSSLTNTAVCDTNLGSYSRIFASTTAGYTYGTTYGVVFNNNGYTVPSGEATLNVASATHIGWTFRQSPGFFNLTSYTGNGSYNINVPHGLGTVPGMIWIKRTDGGTEDWMVWHRGNSTAGTGDHSDGGLSLNSTGVANFANFSTGTTINDSTFLIGNISPVSGGTGGGYTNGASYTAYLFGHDTSTNGFIQCGQYTGNSSTAGPVINLGWEPQWILIKNISASANWLIFDAMLGICFQASDIYDIINGTSTESNGIEYLRPLSNGFQLTASSTLTNTSANNYIYMAIRREMMKPPTDATTVFKPVARAGTSAAATISCGFPPDLVLFKGRTTANGCWWSDRGRGPNYMMASNATTADTLGTGAITSFSQMDGVAVSTNANLNSSSYTYINYFFRRAAGFLDIVYWVGDGVDHTGSMNIPHSLGAVPNLIIWKNLTAGTSNWFVEGDFGGMVQYLNLNSTAAKAPTLSNCIAYTANLLGPGANTDTNVSGNLFVGYLFANCPGVLSTGTYTGDGSIMKLINCGFTNGARFVMVKRIDSTGNWLVSDSARGIGSTADPLFYMNVSGTEQAVDWLIADSRGFYVQPDSGNVANANVSGATYLYLAIA